MPAYRDEKHGTFYASFYYTDFTGARRKKMKRGFKLKRDALEWERQFLLQKNADPDMKFGDFVEIYRGDKRERIREHTWESKDNMINTKILPYFKDRTLSEIEPRDVIAWQNTLMSIRQKNGKPYSPTYLKSIRSQLSAIFNYAVEYYRLKQNPAEIAGNMGKETHREMLFWTKEEYLKFADAVMDKPMPTCSLISRWKWPIAWTMSGQREEGPHVPKSNGCARALAQQDGILSDVAGGKRIAGQLREAIRHDEAGLHDCPSAAKGDRCAGESPSVQGAAQSA